MLIDKALIAKIKKIIEKNYSSLIMSVLGADVFTEEELEELKLLNIDPKTESLMSLIYYHNVINDPNSTLSPTSIQEMRSQQKAIPKDDHHKAVNEHLNETMRTNIDKLKTDTQGKFEGIMREYNFQGRNQVLSGEVLDETMKLQSLSKIKQTLRDATGDLNRNWTRVAATEVSNAIGIGSADRVLELNKDKNPNELYVYRIPVVDAALCKKCREFYLDSDGTPAVYRLSSILGNGTNYGKKQIDWKPVVAATHPNERCSGVVEVRPGWKVKAGGELDFIGYDKWESYITAKIRA